MAPKIKRARVDEVDNEGTGAAKQYGGVWCPFWFEVDWAKLGFVYMAVGHHLGLGNQYV